MQKKKLKKYQKMCEYGWYIELRWEYKKGEFTQFQPLPTQEDAENAVQNFLDVCEIVAFEYVRRFSLYIKKICPDDVLDTDIFQSYVRQHAYIKNFVRRFAEACKYKSISDLLEYIDKNDDLPPKSGFNGSGTKTFKMTQSLNFLRIPLLKMVKYETTFVKVYHFHEDKLKIDMQSFKEFPLNDLLSLFPNSSYARNLFDTTIIRKMRYLILLAQKHDKLSLFGKLPREIIHYICSFMYYGEMLI